ncbi:MAG: fibrobacter succinogenes major paralogous domain-containing protein [Bacteroidota bacterium]
MKKQNLFTFINAVLFLLTTFHQETRSQQTSIMTDIRDGCIYKTVILGGQTWMAENLNYITSDGSWCYNNDSINCERYGRLYNWETAKEVCPAGWHLPSKAEWDTLVIYLGGKEVAGSKLKSNSYWYTKHDSISNYAHVVECSHKNTEKKHDSILINSSYFSGLPGGGYYAGGIFDYEGEFGIWWSATGYNPYNAFYFSLFDTSTEAGIIHHALNSTGFSVRCIKD